MAVDLFKFVSACLKSFKSHNDAVNLLIASVITLKILRYPTFLQAKFYRVATQSNTTDNEMVPVLNQSALFNAQSNLSYSNLTTNPYLIQRQFSRTKKILLIL